MACREVEAAVKARLTAKPITVYGGGALTVVYGNDKADAPSNEWMTVQYYAANETLISMGEVGNRLFRENGGILFTIVRPRGGDRDYALSLCEQVKNLFRAKQFDGVSTFDIGEAALDDDIELGDYVKFGISVEYIFDRLA